MSFSIHHHPAIDTGLAQLEQKINSILDTVNALPLKDTVAGTNAAIAKLNQSLASVNVLLESQSTKGLPDQLNQTLQELNKCIKRSLPRFRDLSQHQFQLATPKSHAGQPGFINAHAI